MVLNFKGCHPFTIPSMLQMMIVNSVSMEPEQIPPLLGGSNIIGV